MASYSDTKRQLRPTPGEYHDDDVQEAPPATKRMKQDGPSSTAATTSTTTAATNYNYDYNSFTVFVAPPLFLPPVAGAAAAVRNERKRIANVIQTKQQHQSWSSPSAKTASPPSGSLHYV
jgi:hypothetical protein